MLNIFSNENLTLHAEKEGEEEKLEKPEDKKDLDKIESKKMNRKFSHGSYLSKYDSKGLYFNKRLETKIKSLRKNFRKRYRIVRSNLMKLMKVLKEFPDIKHIKEHEKTDGKITINVDVVEKLNKIMDKINIEKLKYNNKKEKKKKKRIKNRSRIRNRNRYKSEEYLYPKKKLSKISFSTSLYPLSKRVSYKSNINTLSMENKKNKRKRKKKKKKKKENNIQNAKLHKRKNIYSNRSKLFNKSKTFGKLHRRRKYKNLYEDRKCFYENIYENLNENLNQHIYENMYENLNENMYENLNENMYENLNENMYENMYENLNTNMFEIINDNNREKKYKNSCDNMLENLYGNVYVNELEKSYEKELDNSYKSLNVNEFHNLNNNSLKYKFQKTFYHNALQNYYPNTSVPFNKNYLKNNNFYYYYLNLKNKKHQNVNHYNDTNNVLVTDFYMYSTLNASFNRLNSLKNKNNFHLFNRNIPNMYFKTSNDIIGFNNNNNNNNNSNNNNNNKIESTYMEYDFLKNLPYTKNNNSNNNMLLKYYPEQHTYVHNITQSFFSPNKIFTIRKGKKNKTANQNKQKLKKFVKDEKIRSLLRTATNEDELLRAINFAKKAGLEFEAKLGDKKLNKLKCIN
ncbi:conserved Plasmodium protein, unknown function [Plasmodium sp. DRC-Itaito]|nr:conserved Plasmodium protein, unknown function [Plasmodium sp. DRC-Itaito]